MYTDLISNPHQLQQFPEMSLNMAIAAMDTGMKSLKPFGIFRKQAAIAPHRELERISRELTEKRKANPNLAHVAIGDIPGFPQFKSEKTSPPAPATA